MAWLACLTVTFIFLTPAHAWAWGPITHLVHGSEVLGNLTIVGVSLQQLLRRHRREYLYGCVGADITQAKKYTRAQQAHCHSWQVGWAILGRAESDAEKAFAYGYLTHLAGDVYSHNHFVPTQLIVSFRARMLRHIYWEARFDTLQQSVGREIIHELRSHKFPECDALVKRVVSRTLFSFGTDKQIFNSFIAVHDLEQWHRILQRMATRSRYPLPDELVTRYNTVCHTSIIDVLQHGKRAACQSSDPTGLESLALAKGVRRTLKALDRRKRISDKLQREIDALDARSELEDNPSVPTLLLSTAH